MGYRLKEWEVIYSGTNINRFKRNESDRISFRQKFGLSNELRSVSVSIPLNIPEF